MKLLNRLSSSLLALTLFMPVNALAKTPPEIMNAFKAYKSSMQSNDYQNAIKHAKTAWQKSETLLGDHVMTGDLAYNYGYIEKNRGEKRKAIKALERSADLASLKKSDAAGFRLEREVELVSSMDGITKDSALKNRIKNAIKFAKSNGMGSSVFVGELHVHETSVCSRRLALKMQEHKRQIGSKINRSSTEDGVQDGNKKCAQIAQKAVDIFDNNVSNARPVYVASANNYVGYGFESKKNYLAAALSYQKARETIEGVYGRNDALVAKTIGRWMNARNYLKRKGQLAHAESQGLCKCWPFKDDRPQVEVTKWSEADFPANALRRSSGYAIVQMDVSDAGVPENVRIMNSWPEDIYDKSSLTAAKKLEFAPKTGNEPSGFRKGITIPYSYYLRRGLDPI